MKTTDTSRFDIADYLESKAMIAEYLNTVLEEGDNADVINAIGHVAKAIGMIKIAEETGLSLLQYPLFQGLQLEALNFKFLFDQLHVSTSRKYTAR